MQSKTYNSLYAHAAYVLVTGLQLIFVPNMLLGIFGLSATNEIWIKILGIVLVGLTILYYTIGKIGNAEIVRASIYARWIVSGFFVLMALSGQAPMTLLLFAGFDLATGLWSWFELK